MEYQWRCYVGEHGATGTAPNLEIAERRLLRRYRLADTDAGDFDIFTGCAVPELPPSRTLAPMGSAP
jgi:hypothetical protein